MMFFASFLSHAQYNAGDNSGTSGTNRTFVGVNTGTNNIGANNSFFGRNAGHTNTSGYKNTFIGMQSGFKNTTGDDNIFVGFNAGYSNTTGSRNTFIGSQTGQQHTTGNHNTYVGAAAGVSASSAHYNSFFGRSAGKNTKTGGYNTILGNHAGYFNDSGERNTIVGNYAGYRGNGKDNTIIGNYAGHRATGDRNVLIGNKAGYYEMNNDRLYIDNSDTGTPLIKGDFSANTLSFYGKVGINTLASASYQLYVNGSAFSSGSWVSSDKRYKKDIQTIDSALDKINTMNGVTYSFKQETINGIDFSKQKGEKQIGFIAQELEEVLPELVRKDEAGYYAVNYDGLVPVLVEAVKEQQEEITDLRARLEKLESLLNDSETFQGNVLPANDIDFSGVVLRQNAPNPFGSMTTIEYQLPERVERASLVVSDINGRTINTYIISGKGTVEFDAGRLDGGVYVYAIIVDGKSIANQKMVIQK